VRDKGGLSLVITPNYLSLSFIEQVSNLRQPFATQMDGERDLVHINRGIVTIQTRNGTWYSTLYSPAIGPALRAAISRYDVDVILDGEMISWDSSENKPIPFGSNRAVAEMNRNQRYRDGTLDPRDVDLHKNDMEINVMALSKDPKDDSSSRDMDEDRCWLQFVGMLFLIRIVFCSAPGAINQFFAIASL